MRNTLKELNFEKKMNSEVTKHNNELREHNVELRENNHFLRTSAMTAVKNASENKKMQVKNKNHRV